MCIQSNSLWSLIFLSYWCYNISCGYTEFREVCWLFVVIFVAIYFITHIFFVERKQNSLFKDYVLFYYDNFFSNMFQVKWLLFFVGFFLFCLFFLFFVFLVIVNNNSIRVFYQEKHTENWHTHILEVKILNLKWMNRTHYLLYLSSLAFMWNENVGNVLCAKTVLYV